MAEAVPSPSVARLAGALYLGTIMFGLFAEVGARGPLIVGSDAAATARAILAEEPLFRAGIAADRPQFLSDFNPLFYGTDKGNVVSKGIFDQTLQMALMGSIKATIDCVTAFSETDFRPDMKNLDMPVLVIHGEADEVVPIEATARLVAAMVPGSILKSYPGAPHATCITHKDQVNLDLLALLRS